MKIPRIVRRSAPIARSIPMSWRRSATSVRNVLRMMKPPITSANTPNIVNAKSAT